MLTLRQQSHVELDDLSLAFRFEAIHVWAQFGLDAGRCYVLGA